MASGLQPRTLQEAIVFFAGPMNCQRTHLSVGPFHLFRYLDEQSFRFNERSLDDAARFVLGLKGILSKRLTYVALTGKMKPQMC